MPENGRMGLPIDVLKLILAKLPPSEDINTRLVCKTWNQIISTLPVPELSVFGAEAWQKFYGFNIEGSTSELPKNIRPFVRFLRKQVEGEESALPCSAILMPKGLSFDKLKDLMENPVKGNSTKFGYGSDRNIAALGVQVIKESYWFVMTNDVIKENKNRGITYKQREDFVSQKTKSACQLPTTLEAVVCCVMHHVSSGKYLFRGEFTNKPSSYTLTQDQVEGKPLAVGGFNSAGLGVDNAHIFSVDTDGVSARRKF